MKFLPNNTLAYFTAAPQTHQHDLSALPTSVLAAGTETYKQGCTQSSPCDDAVTFYALNHAASIVRKSFTLNEPLPVWAVQIMVAYTDACIAQGERMLHYLLCITTREMRHLKSCTPAFWGKVEKQYGAESVALLKHISSNGDENTAMNKFLKTPPDMTIGQYVKTLQYGFHHAGGAGWDGSYGGTAWGSVTDALVAMIHGETSLEMLVDTGYTLAHNGGPIFNKGMMYTHYGAELITILDVQRSGQMLDLMLESQTLSIKKTPEAIGAAELIKQYKPSELKGYLDWKLVDALRPEKEKDGSPHKYDKVTGKQTQPLNQKVKAAMKTPKLPTSPASQPVMTTLLGKPIKVTGTWQVYPHQVVTVVERTEK